MAAQHGEEESLPWIMETHLGMTDMLPVFEAGSLAGVHFFCSVLFPRPHAGSQVTGRYGNAASFGCSFCLISVALEGELQGFYV